MSKNFFKLSSLLIAISLSIFMNGCSDSSDKNKTTSQPATQVASTFNAEQEETIKKFFEKHIKEILKAAHPVKSTLIGSQVTFSGNKINISIDYKGMTGQKQLIVSMTLVDNMLDNFKVEKDTAISKPFETTDILKSLFLGIPKDDQGMIASLVKNKLKMEDLSATEMMEVWLRYGWKKENFSNK
jgi:uncharacterized lipoprotein YehR (DUF1307 family)